MYVLIGYLNLFICKIIHFLIKIQVITIKFIFLNEKAVLIFIPPSLSSTLKHLIFRFLSLLIEFYSLHIDFLLIVLKLFFTFNQLILLNIIRFSFHFVCIFFSNIFINSLFFLTIYFV